MRFLPLLFLVVATGCSDTSADADGGAPAVRVVLHTAITADATAKAQFTTNFGWKVTLDQAAVAVGSLYYFDGPPAFTQVRPTWLQRVGDLFEGTAHAHPGHYQAGDALGQMLTAQSYDLLGAPGALPDGEGVSGTYRSGRFVFANATPAGVAALGRHAAFARGVAEKADGTTPAPIHFTAAADFADVAKQTVSAEVDGCAFTETQVAGDGTVTLTVNPKVWFDFVDFTDVAPGTAEAPTALSLADKAGIGFVSGLTQLDAYRFSYSP